MPHTPARTGQLSINGGAWSGWEDNNQTYYAASGQWTIPCINTSHSPSGSDIGDWVGLGGEGSGHNLLQAGTYWDVNSRTWNSFYEEVGTSSYTHGVDEFAPETCGHNMFAEVDYGQTYVSQSYYFVQDLTTDAYWTNHNYFAPAFNTAEWIDEASSCKQGVWHMFASYGDVF